MTEPVTRVDEPGQDDGLRRMLVWVLVTLVLAVVAAALIAQLAILWFDVP
jgi:hypothetical protein